MRRFDVFYCPKLDEILVWDVQENLILESVTILSGTNYDEYLFIGHL